jgi:ribosomal protein L11 methylase PrmA
MPIKIEIEDSSFRDTYGHVYHYDNKILRTVNNVAKKEYEFVRDNEVLSKSIQKKFLIETSEIDKSEFNNEFSKASYLLKSKLIPYISYPYEWSFNQLKAAALHHLKFQLFLFDQKAVLRDASAYNIQFIGSEPIFIDVLSIKEYQEGEYWFAYKQFCENFLNPLLLRSLKGVSHNKWFRGALEGIETIELNKLLSLTDKISWKVFVHVVLQANFIQKAINNPKTSSKKVKKLRHFSGGSYKGMLIQLYTWIENLSLKNNKTIWDDYSITNTYKSKEFEDKKNIVNEFVKKFKPDKLIDLGCNTGQYSEEALRSGANYVVGYDFDQNTIDDAFENSKLKKINFLPLIFDATNPSPNQGWMQKERKGFFERNKAKALIALAFEHHLAIAKNIPLDQIIEWLTKLAPVGLIEFVPKLDETVKRMLENREDIFEEYTQLNFENILESRSKIIKKSIVSSSGRIIYEFETL